MRSLSLWYDKAIIPASNVEVYQVKHDLTWILYTGRLGFLFPAIQLFSLKVRFGARTQRAIVQERARIRGKQ